DASGNDNVGSAMYGPTLGVDAVLGRGVAFDGTDDMIRVAKSTSLSATTGHATFALWVNWTSLTSSHFQRVMSSSNRFNGGTLDDGYEWAAQPGGDFFLYPWGRVNDYNLGPNPFTAGVWQYLVGTTDFTGPSVKIYADGQAMPFSVTYEAAWTTLADPDDWCWGDNPVYTGAFGGSMDEIRVIDGVKGPEWVQTSFANQKPGSTMVTVGAQQMLEP
ncbi:MAG TPA: LamG-like jellyroll fold domain-containing protein, partial [Ilumatobacteraceae bacterium]|nr:LamG-like jellyroll fold domain-containing protein [Ilumatobacteraceae bacterium]